MAGRPKGSTTSFAKRANALPPIRFDRTAYLKDIDPDNVHQHIDQEKPTGNDPDAPADRNPPLPDAPRTALGQFAPGSISPQSAGGMAKRGKVRASVRLSLADPDKSDMKAYYDSGETLRRKICSDIRDHTGDCGTSVTSLVASACLAKVEELYHADLAMKSKKVAERAKLAMMAKGFLEAHTRCIIAAWKLAKDNAEGKPPAQRDEVIEIADNMEERNDSGTDDTDQG